MAAKVKKKKDLPTIHLNIQIHPSKFPNLTQKHYLYPQTKI